MKRDKIKYIQEVLTKLEPLKKISQKHRTSIVPLLSDDCIHKICEGCQNLLQNTFDLDKNKTRIVQRRLKKHRRVMRLFSKPETSIRRKRKILANQQIGSGIFSILASTIIPALVAAITKWHVTDVLTSTYKSLCRSPTWLVRACFPSKHDEFWCSSNRPRNYNNFALHLQHIACCILPLKNSRDRLSGPASDKNKICRRAELYQTG